MELFQKTYSSSGYASAFAKAPALASTPSLR